MLENVSINVGKCWHKTLKNFNFFPVKTCIFSDKVGQDSDTKNDKRQNQNIDIIIWLLLIYKGISEKENETNRNSYSEKTKKINVKAWQKVWQKNFYKLFKNN